MDTDIFRARLTAARLSRPQIDTLYALHAARIQYIPFQFKPLLRFLRADQPRLLIADEVGVGKTIEAGLILKEMQARQDVGNVLIVCPKALVQKWRTEMRRFDEDFRPLNSDQLQYCLNEAHVDGAWPVQYSRAIVHLELLRIDDYLGGDGRTSRRGLRDLDPPPQFGLVIVDEAHHLRNAGTSSHTLARFLCENSEAVVFLSATPVQIGSRNLNTLLNLLRPDLFPDEAIFAEIIEPNRFLMTAMRHIRSRMPHVSIRG
ncbi:MAG: SNF2-related protein [Thermomicrobiales bacterium]